MIHAVAALALPKAQLSEEDAKALAEFEDFISKDLEANFDRGARAVEFQIQVMSPIRIDEIMRRGQMAGWDVRYETMIEVSRLTEPPQKIVTGYRFIFSPSLESFKEAASNIQDVVGAAKLNEEDPRQTSFFADDCR